MRILLVGSFEYAMYAPAFEAGFKSLGHEVFSIDYDKYKLKNSFIFRFLNRIQDRYHIGIFLAKYNHDILQAATAFKPNFIFLYRCYSVKQTTIIRLKNEGFFIFTYNNDDPFSYKPSRYFFRHYFQTTKNADVNLVYRQKNVEDFKRLGIENIRIILPYFITKNNYRIPVKRDIPVAFLGHYENDGRDRLILALKHAGVPVTIFGGGQYWKQSPLYDSLRDIMQPGMPGPSYNETINRLQIALVFFSKLNHDTYTRRCFEIPATKTLMLSEYSVDMDDMFPEDECACYFRNEDELVRKCRYLLSNPEEIKRIAENGYNRLLKIGGSEIDRCKQIINIYDGLRN